MPAQMRMPDGFVLLGDTGLIGRFTPARPIDKDSKLEVLRAHPFPNPPTRGRRRAPECDDRPRWLPVDPAALRGGCTCAVCFGWKDPR